METTEKPTVPYPCPTFADKNEPSAALALLALGVKLRYNLRSLRAELIQMTDSESQLSVGHPDLL